MAVFFSQACDLLTKPAPSPACYHPDDVERLFGVTYTLEQRVALQHVPFTEEVLKACAGTHMLFPGFALSLLDIQAKHAALFCTKKGGWYSEEKQAFSRLPVPLQWHLLRTTPVPESFDKTWDQQRKLLLPDEEVPSAAIVAFATMLHFKATGQRLLEKCYVRTSDVVSDGGRVGVGSFDAGGFHVSDSWDVSRGDDLGVSASRKF